MNYYIDYEQTTGKILGYLADATVNQKKGDTIEVDFLKYNDAMAFNKLIIDGDNISFDKVDFRTPKEIDEQIQNEFRKERDDLLSTVVDHYQKPLVWEILTVEQQDKVRVYRQALLDSTNTWILPEEVVL